MDVKIEITGLKELQSKMTALEQKHFSYAVKEALNKTAKQVKEAEIKQMHRSFDRPTPYSLNSLYIDYAYKSQTKGTKLEAAVKFKDEQSLGKGGVPAAKYILPNVIGGPRNLKGFESALRSHGVLLNGYYVVPGEACQLDSYGNIPHGLIYSILSYFRASKKSEGYDSNITDKRKKKLWGGSKRKQTMGFGYFVSYGKLSSSAQDFYAGASKREQGPLRTQHLKPGIYKRFNMGFGSDPIKPIFMFVKTPKYKKRFPFLETAQKVIDQNLNSNFREAMDNAIKTAK